MSEVQIVMPSGALGASADDDMLDTAMRIIGVAFGEKGEWSSKYGTTYENDTFMMHQYCWCESDDCPWCAGCDCPEGSCHFFVDGKEVTSAEYMAFFDREAGVCTNYDGQAYVDWQAKAAAANERRTTRHDPVCAYCTGSPFEKFGGVPGKGAPNFWFKPSGFRLWWYKYIGRGHKIHGALPPDFMNQVFTTHPSGMTFDAAIKEFARREQESAKALAEMFSSLGNIARS